MMQHYELTDEGSLTVTCLSELAKQPPSSTD